MHRRQFIAGSMASAALLADVATAREPIERSGPPRFRLGLAAYSLRNYFSWNKTRPQTPATDHTPINMFEFLDYCAALNLDGAELTSYYFNSDANTDYLLRLKHHAYLQGLAISGTAIGNDFTVSPGHELETQIKQAKAWIDRAAVLGAPHVRFFAGTAAQLAAHPERLAQAAAAIDDCAQHAASSGIFLGIENHGQLTAVQMLELMKHVNNRWVGISLDTGNFNSEDPYADLARCVPYAVNVQVKVSMVRPDGTRYPADFNKIGEILRTGGYQGFVILEYEEERPFEHIPATVERLRASLNV